MAEHIIRKADESGYPVDRLTIEVTETAALDSDAARAALVRLSGAGVTLAMDDFGSGATLLTNLERLPFSYMKLDGFYVEDIAENPKYQELVSGLARLARTLDVSVIAEHVSYDYTMDFLKSSGIEYAQGFYLGKPTPMTESLPA